MYTEDVVQKITDVLLNSDFTKFLEMLRETNWVKANSKKRIEFMTLFNEVVGKTNESLVREFRTYELSKEGEDASFCDDTIIGMDKKTFTRPFNSYSIISLYFFELFTNYLTNIGYDAFENDNVNDENFNFLVNCAYSPFGTWNNLYKEENLEYWYQPITLTAKYMSYRICYNIEKYIFDKYGMDDFLGEHLNNITMSAISEKSSTERTNNNYQEMLKKFDMTDGETNRLAEIIGVLENYKPISELTDSEFYSLFNDCIFSLEKHKKIPLYNEFVIRELKYIKLARKFGWFGWGNGGLTHNNEFVGNGNECAEFYTIINKLANFKIDEGLMDEITDEEYKKEIQLSKKYQSAFVKGTTYTNSKYLTQAYANVEYCILYLSKCVDKIQNAMNEYEKYKGMGPLVTKAADNKQYEAYLNFTFGLTYDEVKKRQFEDLERAYKKKVGGRK